MIKVKYPGKLYLLGEYSVMEPGNSAIVCAVDRYITVEIFKAKEFNIKSSHGFLRGNEIFTSETMPHVVSACVTIKEYLEYKNISMQPFSINIISELDDAHKKKYGFGSSGVVIVGIIDAIAKFHQLKIDELTLFKLSTIAQYKMGELSSGGDLATAVVGGIIKYTRYDVTVLSDSISIVDKVWPLLEIETINKDFEVLVGWTKKAHRTPHSLAIIEEKKCLDSGAYDKFMIEAQEIVDAFDLNPLEAIIKYRKWMLKFSIWSGVHIETPELTTFIETCQQFGMVAKVSGAGGGDCGIAITNREIDSQALTVQLQKNNIEVLEGVIK